MLPCGPQLSTSTLGLRPSLPPEDDLPQAEGIEFALHQQQCLSSGQRLHPEQQAFTTSPLAEAL